jgi:hypothetical protein
MMSATISTFDNPLGPLFQALVGCGNYHFALDLRVWYRSLQRTIVNGDPLRGCWNVESWLFSVRAWSLVTGYSTSRAWLICALAQVPTTEVSYSRP